jgi:hypothetical protein
MFSYRSRQYGGEDPEVTQFPDFPELQMGQEQSTAAEQDMQLPRPIAEYSETDDVLVEPTIAPIQSAIPNYGSSDDALAHVASSQFNDAEEAFQMPTQMPVYEQSASEFVSPFVNSFEGTGHMAEQPSAELVAAQIEAPTELPESIAGLETDAPIEYAPRLRSMLMPSNQQDIGTVQQGMVDEQLGLETIQLPADLEREFNAPSEQPQVGGRRGHTRTSTHSSKSAQLPWWRDGESAFSSDSHMPQEDTEAVERRIHGFVTKQIKRQTRTVSRVAGVVSSDSSSASDSAKSSGSSNTGKSERQKTKWNLLMDKIRKWAQTAAHPVVCKTPDFNLAAISKIASAYKKKYENTAGMQGKENEDKLYEQINRDVDADFPPSRAKSNPKGVPGWEKLMGYAKGKN